MRNSLPTFIKAAIALAFLAAPLAANGQTVRYNVVPLTEVPSPTGCVPTAINDNGDVVGYCNAGELESFGVVWRGGTVEDLGKWEAGTFTHAWAINSSGQIVGDGDDDDLTSKALIRGATRWIQIDGSGGSAQQAYGITDDGVIFGNYTTTGSPGTEDWDPVYWTYDAEGDRYDRNDLPKPPGTVVSGAFIFAATKFGTAVGQLASDLLTGNEAGLWNNDPSHSLVVLGRPGAIFSSGAVAFGVSDDARAVGAFIGIGGSQHAVLWENDGAHTPVALGALAGDLESIAYGVNTAGQVVGVSGGPGIVPRGFLYQDGTLAELTTLIDAADGAWTIHDTLGINNAGQIIAVGVLDGERHPVMLVPSAVPTKIASLTLTADREAPQVAGTSITFTAAATGGSAPYQFKWLVFDGVSSTIASDWSTGASFAWTPATANASYTVTVWARSDGHGEDVPEKTAEMAFPITAAPVSAVTLTADKTAPQVPGTAVTFTASATGGTEPVEFKWLVFDGVSSLVVNDWSTTATFAWTPATANASYSVSVWVRSAGNGEDVPEQTAEMPFPIVAPPLSGVTLTANMPVPQLLGTAVTFTATATGGVEPVEFKWLVFDGVSSTVASEWSTTATFVWAPATANLLYSVTVWARSAGNANDVPEQTATMAFPILPNPLAGLLTMAADKKSPEKPGTTVTFTAAVVGAVTPVQFKWLVFNGVAWTVASEWSTTATFAWTPATANGSYKVSVWARSAGSTADAAEKSAEMAFPIRGKAPKVRMAHREERKDHREERKDHGEERKDHERDRSRR